MKGRINNDNFFRAILAQNLLDYAIELIQANLEPEDVFSERELATWAEVWAVNNGYIKE